MLISFLSCRRHYQYLANRIGLAGAATELDIPASLSARLGHAKKALPNDTRPRQ
jgi:hypothetical protein